MVYRGSLSRNVMRVFDLDVLDPWAGKSARRQAVRTLRRHDRRRNIYRKLVLCEDVLVGAMLVNAVEQGGVLLGLIQNQTPLPIPARKTAGAAFNVRQPDAFELTQTTDMGQRDNSTISKEATMKQVVVHPERCVGCMQCMLVCAVAHSRTGQLLRR